jgi:hypothetical protein
VSSSIKDAGKMTEKTINTDARAFRFVDSRGAETSSTGFAKELLADAVENIDSKLAEAMRSEPNWRKTYQGYFLQIGRLEFIDRNIGFDLANSALGLLGSRIVDRDGASLASLAAGGFAQRGLVQTMRITGSAKPERYWPNANETLVELAEGWHSRGLAEADVVSAFGFLQQNSNLPIAQDLLIALAGNAELAATKDWLSLGGRVAVVARQNQSAWQELIAHARNTAGTLLIPVSAESSITNIKTDEELSRIAGLNFVEQIEATASWVHELSRTEDRIVLASFAYVGGSNQIVAQAAQDCIVAVASENLPKSKVAISYLATPLDVVVADESLAQKQLAAFDMRSMRERLRDWFWQRIGHLVAARPELQQTAKDPFTIFDASASRQGPSYLLAKHSEKWRALVSAKRGNLVSFTVAPPATTRSVLGVKIIENTYRGLARFGVEPFDASVARRSMALILLRSLHDPASPASPKNSVGNQVALVSATAIHGGIWRLGYHPDSIWVPATLLGWITKKTRRSVH